MFEVHCIRNNQGALLQVVCPLLLSLVLSFLADSVFEERKINIIVMNQLLLHVEIRIFLKKITLSS